MICQFAVPTGLRAWQRAASHHGRRITSRGQREHQAYLARLALDARPAGWPLDARYVLEVRAYCRGSNPDVDNLVKQVMDALQRPRGGGVGILWDDDRQVERVVADKVPGHVVSKAYVTATVIEGAGARRG